MGGAASSWMLDVLGQKMIARDFKPAFAVKHQQKDLAIVLATAREKRRASAGSRRSRTSSSRRSRRRGAAKTEPRLC